MSTRNVYQRDQDASGHGIHNLPDGVLPGDAANVDQIPVIGVGEIGQVVASGVIESRAFTLPAGKRVLGIAVAIESPLTAEIEVGASKNFDVTFALAGTGSATDYVAYFANNTADAITFSWSPVFV